MRDYVDYRITGSINTIISNEKVNKDESRYTWGACPKERLFNNTCCDLKISGNDETGRRESFHSSNSNQKIFFELQDCPNHLRCRCSRVDEVLHV